MRWFNNNTRQWQIDDGEYVVYVGSSVEDIRLEQSITLDITNQTKSYWIHEDTYVYELVLRKNEIKQSLKQYQLDELIGKVTEDPELAPLFENLPLRSLIMLDMDIATVHDFINAANEELKHK